MKTDTSDGTPPCTAGTPPASTVFELLTHRHRRYALYYLSQRLGAVGLPDLVEAITLREGERAPDRLAAEFHHRHLPKLVDAGVVEYDPDRERIRRLPAAEALDPHLELAIGRDRHC